MNRRHLEMGQLEVITLGRGNAWLDTGTHESMLEASAFIATIGWRQGSKAASPEEIAWRMGYIDNEALARLAARLGKSGYGAYLEGLLSEKGVQ